MIRALVIASLMLAAGPAFAETAAPKTPKPKPPKQVTVSGCTASEFAGCHVLKVGKQNILLTAKPDVVLPPANTFVVATGTMQDPPHTFCRVSKQLIASKIIATKRRCK